MADGRVGKIVGADDGSHYVTTTMRITPELRKRWKLAAFNNDKSMNELAIEALEEYLEKLEK